MNGIVSIQNLEKQYKGGFKALKNINLDIKEGEIFGLLGPNGAGKTTLISVICGIVTPSQGSIQVGGYDIIEDYRKTRSMIGLVPQELTTDMFETVWDTACYSRGLFGKPHNSEIIEDILKKLSLWDKRNNKILELSGGMKRRVLIAKALSHEPKVLFLDEPTAGVDVELRQDMWNLVSNLRKSGVTIILTTHYIEEAEEMADRIGIINRGEIVLVDQTKNIMNQLGQKELQIELKKPLEKMPESLQTFDLSLCENNSTLTFKYDTRSDNNGVSKLLKTLNQENIDFKDLQTEQSSLEEIFINLVRKQ